MCCWSACGALTRFDNMPGHPNSHSSAPLPSTQNLGPVLGGGDILPSARAASALAHPPLLHVSAAATFFLGLGPRAGRPFTLSASLAGAAPPLASALGFSTTAGVSAAFSACTQQQQQLTSGQQLGHRSSNAAGHCHAGVAAVAETNLCKTSNAFDEYDLPVEKHQKV